MQSHTILELELLFCAVFLNKRIKIPLKIKVEAQLRILEVINPFALP